MIRQLSYYSAVHSEAKREINPSMTQFRTLHFIRAGQSLSVSDIGSALGLRTRYPFARMIVRGCEAWLIALHEAVQAFSESDTSP